MGNIVDTLKYEFPVTALQFDSRKVIACTGENGVEVSVGIIRMRSAYRCDPP